MKVTSYVLKAFGVNDSGGNPAGVVLDAEKLLREEKMRVAKILGFSEAAFVSKSKLADFKVEFFTPNEEIDMCGHATIATFYYLYHSRIVKPGLYTQETKAGVLKMEVKDDGTIIMDQKLPEYFGYVKVEILADALNVNKEAILKTNLKPQIVSTGYRDIMVGLIDRQELFNLKVNQDKISKINKDTETTGIHVFTLDTFYPDSIAHCRNFSPLYGIPEDPATGGDAGALACYLFKNGKLKTTKGLIIEQGYAINKPSKILVDLEVKNGDIARVRVGGKAVYLGGKEINL